jgi:hypothetical protein
MFSSQHVTRKRSQGPEGLPMLSSWSNYHVVLVTFSEEDLCIFTETLDTVSFGDKETSSNSSCQAKITPSIRIPPELGIISYYKLRDCSKKLY